MHHGRGGVESAGRMPWQDSPKGDRCFPWRWTRHGQNYFCIEEQSHHFSLGGSSSTLGKQDWMCSPRISPSQDLISLSPLRQCHDTSQSWPIRQHHQDHWKMALRRLPHLPSRSGRHLHQGRQCGHEEIHVVHQHWPPPTTTPPFRSLIIVTSSTISMLASKTRNSIFLLSDYSSYFQLTGFLIFHRLGINWGSSY